MSIDNLKLSYSSLNLFSSCERKFELTKLYDRRPFDGDTFAAEVGKALHAGYQNYLTNHDPDKALWELARAYPHDIYFLSDPSKVESRSIEACVVTLDAMLERGGSEGWELAYIKNHLGETVPAIEVPFEIILDGFELADGRGISFVGFIDAIMFRGDTYRTLDIKTHQNYSRDYNAQYKFDTQQIPYGIVLEHVLQKEIEKFDVLYLDCKIDVAEPVIELVEFTKDRDDIQEWLMNTVMKVQQIQRNMEMDYFPRRDGGCVMWNKPCFYLRDNVCSMRDKEQIQKWFLEGQDFEPPRDPIVPWITGHINLHAGVER